MTPAEQTATTIPAPPIKQCGCGAVHTAVEWSYLPFVGKQDDGAGGILELRNCTAPSRNGEPCLSTIAIQVRS
jgi:hypothetical protein